MTQTVPLRLIAARDLACFSAGLPFEDIPFYVIDHVTSCVLDRPGVALFNTRLQWNNHARDLAGPVALIFAESAGTISGGAALTAIAACYEVGARVGNAVTMALFMLGFHRQGTTLFCRGRYRLADPGLSAEATQHASGIDGSMGAELKAAQEGAMVERLRAGRVQPYHERLRPLGDSGRTVFLLD